MEDRTCIVVAHRLTTVQKCTRIAVIEDGKVIEEGSYDALIEQEGGFFSNLAKGMKVQDKQEQKRMSSFKKRD